MTKLVAVTITTTLGARYEFPDMDRAEMEKVLSHLGSGHIGQLTLVNVSQAVLVLPFRIVEQMLVDGEVRWPSSA